jgi:hypothetical protein
MTPRLPLTRRRAQKRDRLPRLRSRRQLSDHLGIGPLLHPIFRQISRPGNRRTALGIHRRMKRLARPEFGKPLIPSLLRLAHPARPIARNQQPKPITRLGRIIPSLRFDRHVETQFLSLLDTAEPRRRKDREGGREEKKFKSIFSSRFPSCPLRLRGSVLRVFRTNLFKIRCLTSHSMPIVCLRQGNTDDSN